MKKFFIITTLLFTTNLFAQKAPVSVVSSEGRLVLANVIGQTLYTFDPDSQTESRCYEACAEKWPPLLLSAEEANALSGNLGFIERRNGLKQLTHNGSPVYTFYLDRAEGDALGDGLGSVWHIIRLY